MRAGGLESTWMERVEQPVYTRASLLMRSKMESTEPQNPERVVPPCLVIDTHADTPQRFLDERFDLGDPLHEGNFNLDSARSGGLGAQFFAIWAEPERYKGHYARRTLALIDAVKQQVAGHSDEVELVTSASGIERAHARRKFAALMGIEGGHAIEDSLDLLRRYYALGVRYMTLTWANSNGWADSSGDIDDPGVPHTAEGLSEFGKDVVREMNRLGMMVDVSHVSDRTFYCTLQVSCAPVIASHSCARALCHSPRNLTDDMLRAIARSGGPQSRGGVVMVNFYSAFLSPAYRDALRKMQPQIEQAVADARAKAAAEGLPFNYGREAAVRRACMDRIPRPPFSLLIDHIEHIVRIAGIDHVGLGSDFDGVYGQLPEGMDSPADFPRITAALQERGYSTKERGKILGENVMRVFREVEAV